MCRHGRRGLATRCIITRLSATKKKTKDQQEDTFKLPCRGTTAKYELAAERKACRRCVGDIWVSTIIPAHRQTPDVPNAIAREKTAGFFFLFRRSFSRSAIYFRRGTGNGATPPHQASLHHSVYVSANYRHVLLIFVYTRARLLFPGLFLTRVCLVFFFLLPSSAILFILPALSPYGIAFGKELVYSSLSSPFFFLLLLVSSVRLGADLY